MKVYGKWAAAGLTAALTMTAPAVASAAPAAPDQGSMIVLGDLGGGTRNSHASTVNRRGDIAGVSYSKAAGREVPVVWWHGRTAPTPLGVPNGRPAAINEHGAVAGTVTGTTKVFLWRNGRSSYYQCPGSFDEFGVSMNDLEQMVVSTWSYTTQSGRAYLLERGVFTDLPTPTGSSSGAIEITNQGQILGSLGGTFGDRTVIWSRSGSPARPRWTRVDLGDLGGGSSYPWDINEKGQVIGISSVPGEHFLRPFLWQNGVMTDLTASQPVVEGRATAINDAGLVVGYVTQTWDTTNAAVVWLDGRWVKIGPVGYNSEADVVNNRGQAAGYGSTSVGGRYSQSLFRWDASGTTLFTVADPVIATAGFLVVGIDDSGHVVATAQFENGAVVLRSVD